jgi:hypothetical protein
MSVCGFLVNLVLFFLLHLTRLGSVLISLCWWYRPGIYLPGLYNDSVGNDCPQSSVKERQEQNNLSSTCLLIALLEASILAAVIHLLLHTSSNLPRNPSVIIAFAAAIVSS